jgi:hypothetical protein
MSLEESWSVADGSSLPAKKEFYCKIPVGVLPAETRETNASPISDSGLPVKEVWSAVCAFAAWLDKHGYASYDPYDVWGTRYGRMARRLYYKKNPVGFVLTMPILCMEIIFPGLRGLFVEKDRYPTAEAQLALAFLNLYEDSKKNPATTSDRTAHADRSPEPDAWLGKAKNLADNLLSQSVPGYRGYCWGYPFDWQNVHGLIPKGTPHITATPYCYEVFTRLFDLTGDERYLDIVRSIVAFVQEDLTDTPTGRESAASSYTPHDHTKVINASSYRAFVLFDAAQRFREDALREKAWKNLRFILERQQTDGSWLYAIDSPSEAFIDNFHTCFVLKNLFKINRSVQSADVRRAIHHGYRWYRKALFDEQDNPKTFAIAPRLQTVRLEMYNIAEAITLGALLRNEIPGALALAETLAVRLIRCHSLPAGYWVTRVYRGGIKHKVPFLRWPQSQLFLSLTNLLLAADDSSTRVNPNIQ